MCPTCNRQDYDARMVDCRRTAKAVTVDTCWSNRGDGYCAHHPNADVCLDFGPVYPTRAAAAKAYAEMELRHYYPGRIRAVRRGNGRYRCYAV